jgi:molybdate transport system permease protein
VRSRAPLLVTILAGLGIAFVALPVLSLVIRADWDELGTTLSSSGGWVALRLSLVVSLAATAVSALLGVPIAWLLARVPFPGRAIVRAVVILPLVLPPVVGGIGLLEALGRGGIVGGFLHDQLGIQITFTMGAAVLAAAFVSMPLMILATEAGLRSIDRRYERAAAALGGRPWYVWRRVTLPFLAPQLAAGAVLVWARALGEFGATLTFAGNLAGRTQTLPLAVFEIRQTDPDAAVMLSLLLVALSIAILVALRERITQAT